MISLDHPQPPAVLPPRPPVAATRRGHVQIVDGALLVGGAPVFLFGGELQYFRVRDRGFDPEATWDRWEQSLELMQQAGMNLVTTYVPWDYHSPAPGVWDFSGARDLARFLAMVARRGLYLIFKPGPLITAEWPDGPGSFGAVPRWWKRAHPEALALQADGRPFSFSSRGAPDERQPSYLHPTFLAAARAWLARALAFARPYVGSNLVGVQLDNETNFYWGRRFGGVDYSPAALAHFARFLARCHGEIGRLNQLYGSSYASFDEVPPPRRAPSLLAGRGEGPGAAATENARLADWIAAGHAQILEYLDTLRLFIEAEGFREPDLLLLTNDSPFGLNLGRLPLRDVQLYDGAVKNRVALTTLDLYPKQYLTSRALQDQPFQADYFTRLYDHHGDLATGEQDFILAAELQGGFWSAPLVGAPPVRPAATDQLLARSIGRGLKGGSVYVVRGGWNADGSSYDYLAAIGADGRPRERYDVLRRWGQLLARHGERLLRAREVRDPIAILQHGRHATPAHGVLDHLQRVHTIEQPALLGWLACAGYNPEVLDARLVDGAALRRHSVVFFQNPEVIDARTAGLLHDYVRGGGLLVMLLWPGSEDRRLRDLFPLRPDGHRVWRSPSRAGRLRASLGRRGEDGDVVVDSYWYATFWQSAPTAASCTPFLWERTALGRRGRVAGYWIEDELGRRVLLGTSPHALFNQGRYYQVQPARIERATALARWLLARGGVAPTLRAGRPRELAWARVAGETVYLFVINDNARDARVHLELVLPGALGLNPARRYRVTCAFDGSPLASGTGAALAAGGLELDVAGHRAAVAVLEPAHDQEEPG